ncbi:MAG TPA: methylmalonyl Co-A mutase-associated GTPase MeaB [Burkholderiales bacterium]|nr:methylmalonyl Co-A mutase-associated GTPase MeaB [Burkholderiales bacterium]
MNAPAALAERIRSGDRRAIGRAITLVENASPGSRALRTALAEFVGRARVVGVTGPPGAGKSTLVNALIRELLARGQRVAVVAVDPSSPLSGGALLGDRIRMGEHQADERVFIRSLASRGHAGGLARTTGEVVDVLDAAGFDTIIVETVGAGQSEVDIARLAGTSLVICPPGLGDEVQALKAGILEVADALVVNKADLPDAARTEAELRTMLELRRRGPKTPLLKTVATSGQGVAALADFLAQRPLRPKSAVHADELTRLLSRDAFGAHLGIEFVGGAEGCATLRLRVGPQHLNLWNGCHGGAMFSLADMALGLLCNSRGKQGALIDAHMTFSVAVKEGDLLTAQAVEVSRTKKLGIYRSDVRRQDGTLVASLTGTVYLADELSPR